MIDNKVSIGIDLGTTFSSISYVDENGEPKIIINSEGERTTPSAVFFDEENVVVGQIAKDNASNEPKNVILFIKRQIGNPNWYLEYKGEKLSPTDVSAFILKKLINDAKKNFHSEILNTVITVPAYYEDTRRRSTLTAANIAGINNVELINEPTAAAIAFGVEKSEKDESVLVYDLGGGTFDVTLMIVQNMGKDIRIIASDGDHQLGGKDFDDAIIRYCVEKFSEEFNFDPTEDPYERQQLLLDAEKAKKELSQREKTSITVRANGKRIKLALTKEEFEKRISSKIDTTFSLIREVLREAKINKSEIDRILLIGGSTRIPLVRNRIFEFFKKQPDFSINPDEAVSLGAAIMAAKRRLEINAESVSEKVQEKVGGLVISDVVSKSIGVEAFTPIGTKINSILIRKNSPIPAEHSKEFVTTLQGQTAIKLTIYQGEFENPAFCNPVGEFVMSGLPPNRSPGKKVRVTIKCTENGIIEVSAKDIESGVQAITKVSYHISESKNKINLKQSLLNATKIE